jgi:hypothetical protein
MVVQNGALVYDIDRVGRGVSSADGARLWDNQYTATDPRSAYRGKPPAGEK